MSDTPKLKPVLGSFVVALTDDEMTKIGHPYIVHSLWTDENEGQGVSVTLWDGCGAGLNEGEYELLSKAAPQVKPLVFGPEQVWCAQPAWYATPEDGQYCIVDHSQHGNDFSIDNLRMLQCNQVLICSPNGVGSFKSFV